MKEQLRGFCFFSKELHVSLQLHIYRYIPSTQTGYLGLQLFYRPPKSHFRGGARRFAVKIAKVGLGNYGWTPLVIVIRA